MKSRCNPNAYIQLLNNKIDSIKCSFDTTYVYFTWNDNCSIRPKFKLIKINKGLLELKMDNINDEWAACNCEYQIKLAIPKIQARDFFLKVNDSIVKPNLNRYNASVIREYLNSPRTLKREIYSINGIIIIECFYDKLGKLVKEIFYDNYYGTFRFENDY